MARRLRGAMIDLAETGHGDVVKLKDVRPPEWRLRVGDRRAFFRGSGEMRRKSTYSGFGGETRHMDTRPETRVADEVWIATALLHRRHPDRDDFTVREIVRQAETEKIADGPLRPGVQVHAYLHCVANKAPNPGRHRTLFETSKGRRRLFRPGDPCHPRRSSGKDLPRDDEIPPACRGLIEWYRNEYAGGGGRREADPILSLRGLGKALRAGEDADACVERLRKGWG